MTTPIKYNDAVTGKIDDLLGNFRTEKITIGPVVENAMRAGDAAALKKVLTDVMHSKTQGPDAIIATPVLSLAAFGLLAHETINKKLGGAGRTVLSYHDIFLLGATQQADAAGAVARGKDGLVISSVSGKDLIDHICVLVESLKLQLIRNLDTRKQSGFEGMLTDWRRGETVLERILRERKEEDAKAKLAAERRRERQLAAGFDDEDIALGLADDIK